MVREGARGASILEDTADSMLDRTASSSVRARMLDCIDGWALVKAVLGIEEFRRNPVTTVNGDDAFRSRLRYSYCYALTRLISADGSGKAGSQRIRTTKKEYESHLSVLETSYLYSLREIFLEEVAASKFP